jgi:predicted double-glycine peptidase
MSHYLLVKNINKDNVLLEQKQFAMTKIFFAIYKLILYHHELCIKFKSNSNSKNDLLLQKYFYNLQISFV